MVPEAFSLYTSLRLPLIIREKVLFSMCIIQGMMKDQRNEESKDSACGTDEEVKVPKLLHPDSKESTATNSPTVTSCSVRQDCGDLVVDRIREALCSLAESDDLTFRAKRLQEAEDLCKKLYELPNEWKMLIGDLGMYCLLRVAWATDAQETHSRGQVERLVKTC